VFEKQHQPQSAQVVVLLFGLLFWFVWGVLFVLVIGQEAS